MYPWPSDVFSRTDATSPTGVRVDYKPEVMPINKDNLPFPVDEYNHLDGFSPNSQIRFLFPEGVDGTLLPPITDIARSLEDASTTVLLNADTNTRWVHFSEIDATAPSPDREAVFVRPMKRMDMGAHYIVAVRGLTDKMGTLIEPSAVFRALRDDLPTDVPQIEALRDRYNVIFQKLEAAGVERASLQLAWDFTTASDEALTKDARAMLPDVKTRASAGNLGYTISSVTPDPSPEVAFEIEGTFKVPSYMTGTAGPGSNLARGTDGLPAYQSTVDAPFYIAIPRQVWDAGVPAPVFLYGHGLMGSGTEVFSIARNVTGFIGVATDWWGMCQGDIGFLISNVFGKHLTNARAVPERLLQSIVNFTTLGYLMDGDMVNDPAFMKNGTSLIDPTRLYYIGGSQGGIFGGTAMGFFPHIDRGVLVVGGGVYSQMVWRSVDWPTFDMVWSGYQTEQMDREFLFAVFQSLWDYAEPATYADHLSASPLAGNPDKRIMLVESYGDSQVPNISTEMMARTYGMPMSDPPLYDVYGVPNQPSPIDGSALVQVDTKLGPPPPIENLPGADDNGAHGASADSASIQMMIQDFLLTGQVVHHCTGPCDPD
jgi:hypothetical protein